MMLRLNNFRQIAVLSKLGGEWFFTRFIPFSQNSWHVINAEMKLLCTVKHLNFSVFDICLIWLYFQIPGCTLYMDTPVVSSFEFISYILVTFGFKDNYAPYLSKFAGDRSGIVADMVLTTLRSNLSQPGLWTFTIRRKGWFRVGVGRAR